MSFSLLLPSSYPYVLLSATLIGAQCYMTGFVVPQAKRKKIFTEEFLQNNFGEEHKKEFGTKVPAQGYPDTGNGRYSDKLSYKDWFEFNNAQRVHQNFVESVGIVMMSTLIAGLVFPRAAAITGFVHFFGRLIYTWGYSSKGADKRMAGAALSHGSTLVNIGLAILSALKLAGKI